MPGGYTAEQTVEISTGIGTNAGGSLPTAIAPSGTGNTKGSWVQLTASTSTDGCFAILNFVWAPNSIAAISFDLGIGGAGSEQIVIPDILVEGQSPHGNSWMTAVPVSIPSGTRVAARSQANQGGGNAGYMSLVLLDGSFNQVEGSGLYETIGFNSSGTLGTTVTPSTTSNTKGGYSQLTASTARDYRGFFAAFDSQGNGFNTSGSYQFDIAIGAAASEQVIIPDLVVGDTPSQSLNAGFPLLPFVPLPIPAGTRVAARCQSSSGSINPMGITLYGVF